MNKQSEAMKLVWADPAKREAMLEARTKSENYMSPARGEKISEKAIERWQVPGFREHMSKKMQEVKKDAPCSRYIPVTIDGVYYISIMHAMRATGLKHAEVKRLAMEQSK